MTDEPLGALTVVVAIATLPLGVLSLLFVSWEVSMVVFVVGWFLLTPLIPIVGKVLLPALSDSEPDGQLADPLTELRQRYARGEIGDAEFERQVERLVETEEIDTGRGVVSDQPRDANADLERGH